jgi:hypothetical protein
MHYPERALSRPLGVQLLVRLELLRLADILAVRFGSRRSWHPFGTGTGAATSGLAIPRMHACVAARDVDPHARGFLILR